jgi:AcrR family transcriptional regulator
MGRRPFRTTPSPTAQRVLQSLRRKSGPFSDKILHEARRQFAENGYGISIAQIAKPLGISNAQVHGHFGPKESLFNSALMLAVIDIQSSYALATAMHVRPLDQLDAILQLNVSITEKFRIAFRIFIEHANRNRMGLPVGVDQAVAEFYEYEVGVLAQIIEEGNREGVFRSPDPAGAARFISHHLDGLYFASVIRKDPSIPKGINDVRTLFLRVLCHSE